MGKLKIYKFKWNDFGIPKNRKVSFSIEKSYAIKWRTFKSYKAFKNIMLYDIT